MTVAIVTGGVQGIGAAIGTALLKKGYKVCVADIQKQKGTHFVEQQQKIYGTGNIIFSPCDVAKESEFKNTFDVTLKEFNAVDLLVNNVGIVLEQDPKRLFEVNLTSAMIGCQMALRYMGKEGGGKGGFVINIASILGFLPYSAMPAYTASKHGIIGLTRSFGLPYHFQRNGVIFAALCPSIVDTSLLAAYRTNTLLPEADTSHRCNIMSPEYVSEGLIKILEDRINGSTLIVTKQRGYQYIGYQNELKDFPIE